MPKNSEWLASIKWESGCIECHKNNGGECHNHQCAELYYDKYGNPIPADSVQFDGDYFPRK